MTRFVVRSFLALAALIIPASVRADVILGDIANYAVLANVGSHNYQETSDSGVTGNVGILSNNGTLTGSTSVQLSSGSISGNLYLQGTLAGNATGGKVGGSSAGTPANPNIFTGYSDVLTAYTNATNLSAQYSTSTELVNATTITSSTGITASNGNNDGSAYVFKVDALTFSGFNGTSFTINGNASDYVVIDITGNSNLQISTDILLGGGLAGTSDHVIINVLGVGQQIQYSGKGQNVIQYGDILGINDKFNINGATLDGRLIGGDGMDFQLVSLGYDVQPPSVNLLAVPEPASVVMIVLGGGMAAGFAAYRRRRAS